MPARKKKVVQSAPSRRSARLAAVVRVSPDDDDLDQPTSSSSSYSRRGKLLYYQGFETVTAPSVSVETPEDPLSAFPLVEYPEDPLSAFGSTREVEEEEEFAARPVPIRVRRRVHPPPPVVSAARPVPIRARRRVHPPPLPVVPVSIPIPIRARRRVPPPPIVPPPPPAPLIPFGPAVFPATPAFSLFPVGPPVLVRRFRNTFGRGFIRADRFSVLNQNIGYDFQHAMLALTDPIFDKIERSYVVLGRIPFYFQIGFSIRFVSQTRVDPLTGVGETIDVYFVSKKQPEGHIAFVPPRVTTRRRNFVVLFGNIVRDFLNRASHMNTAPGSDWIFDSIRTVSLVIYSTHLPAVGCSLPTPSFVVDKKATINLSCPDNRCFMWACIVSLFSAELPKHFHRERLSTYFPFENTPLLNFSRVTYPFIPSIENCESFEDDNPGFALFIYGFLPSLDEFMFYFISAKDLATRRPIFLLVINAPAPPPFLPDSDENRFHFVTITNFNRFCSIETKVGASRSHVFCYYCLKAFSSVALRDTHACFARSQTIAREFVLPSTREFARIQYREVKKELDTMESISYEKEVVFVIYMDFESKIDAETNEHVPFSCGMVLTWPSGVFSFPYDIKKFFKIFCSDNPVDLFKQVLAQLEKWSSFAELMYSSYIEFSPLSSKYIQYCRSFVTQKEASKPKRFTDPCDSFDRDPRFNKKTIPIVIHNFKRYDSQFILRYFFQLGYRPRYGSLIGSSLQSLMTISFHQFCFLDSYLFISFSLEKLISFAKMGTNLDETFFHLYLYIHNCIFQLNGITCLESEIKEMLTSKGVFPYSFVDSFEKLTDTVSFPPIAAFHDDVIGKPISLADWNIGKNVWEKLHCPDLMSYHNIYLMRDVLGLADCFQLFRKTMLAKYHLDPVHYLSTPMFTWDAMLRFVQQRRGPNFYIQLFFDKQMSFYEFFEKGRRGGQSFVNFRFADVINGERKGVIKYFDANALYSAALKKKLPIDQFVEIPVHKEGNYVQEWLDKISLTDPEGDAGFFLEVDLDYPVLFHSSLAHKNYPLCVENRVITEEMLSPLQKVAFFQEYHTTRLDTTEKLVSTFFPKKNYVIFLPHLQQVLKLGMILKDVHRVITFKQDAFLSDYIDFNIQQRIESTSEFGKVLFKLMNNSIYGKTIENVKARRNFHIYTTEDGLREALSSPSLKELPDCDNFFSWGCVISTFFKKVFLNKPIFIGVGVLEYAKQIIENFHFNFMMLVFPNARLCLTDTDSLIYWIPDITEDDFTQTLLNSVLDFHSFFDFSNYPHDHPLFFEENKGIPGFFKDEVPPPQKIVAFCGLRPKCYALKLENNTEICKAKGIAQNSLSSVEVVEKNERMNLKFETYRKILFGEQPQLVGNLSRIQPSKEQRIHTETEKKICLTAFDNKWKRFFDNDKHGIEGIPFGSTEIPI